MAAPGLEILFCATKDGISTPHDCLITVFHWSLVSGGFQCTGIGEQATDELHSSEMLPTGWSDNPDLYILRYRKSGKDYMLKVIRIENDLLINFMNIGDENVVNMNIGTSDFTTGDLSSFKSAFKDIDKLCSQFKKEIIQAITTTSTSSASAPTRTSRSRTEEPPRSYEDPLRVPPRHPTHRQQPAPWIDGTDPFSIGRADLDPLSGGGGMLFDPMRARGPRVGPDPNAGLPGRLPPGAVPPGARFDPFGPPGSRVGPDPDHEIPPGYDDMFM